jgi:hypothetical protein
MSEGETSMKRNYNKPTLIKAVATLQAATAGVVTTGISGDS